MAATLGGIAPSAAHSRTLIPRANLGGSLLMGISGMPRRARAPLAARRSGQVLLAGRGPFVVCAAIEPQFPLPTTPGECVKLALGGMERAKAAGHDRFATEFLLPVDQRSFNFMAVEAMDYPCSVKTEYEACSALMSSLLTELDRSVGGGASEMESYMMDDGGGESDLIGVFSPSSKTAAAVVFPTAAAMGEIRKLADSCSKAGRPLFLCNRQWNDRGQVISEFGIGPWKRKAMEFIDSFEPVFTLTEQRIGDATGAASITGGVVRILKVYPSQYMTFIMTRDGGSECIMVSEEEPRYSELEDVVRVWKLENERDALPLMFGGNGSSPMPAVEVLENIDPDNIVKFREDEIAVMDKKTLQRLLNLYGVPTSGKLSVLKQRLVEMQEEKA